MLSRDKSKDETGVRERRARKIEKLPPKGSAARVLFASGLWSDMTPEEIEHVKREILSARKSAA